MKHTALIDIVESAHQTGEQLAPEVAALHIVDPIAETLEFLVFLLTDARDERAIREAFPENAPGDYLALPAGYNSTWLW